jgi:putative hemolysin
MNKNCKWKRFHKVGENQSTAVVTGVKGVDYISMYRLFEICWKNDIHTLPKKPHTHLQYVHNNCARFEECQANGVRRVDYTKLMPSMQNMLEK